MIEPYPGYIEHQSQKTQVPVARIDLVNVSVISTCPAEQWDDEEAE